MSSYQVSWRLLIKDVESGHLSSNRIGSLYAALTDVDAIIKAARGMAHAATQGRITARSFSP